MEIDNIRLYCLEKPEVTEGFPFGEGVLVFKVANKMFALLALDNIPPSMNLKCDPEYALELRENHPAIRPGYHMNKRHWNTIDFNNTLESNLITSMIDHSFGLVVKSLKKADRERILSNL